MAVDDKTPRFGRFAWHEVNVRPGSSAVAFYQALFGWGVSEFDLGADGVYKLFLRDGVPFAGSYEMIHPFWKGAPPHWMSYIGVEDIEATARKAVALGGRVLQPPVEVAASGVGGHVARFALLEDAAGAAIGIIQVPPEQG